MKTLGRLEMQTPFTDLAIFIGANRFTPLTAATAVLTSVSPGLLTQNVPASTTANLFSSLSEVIIRSGQGATPAVNQQQFGTAALQPGPSGVAGTTDPLNLPGGFPPWTNAVNPAISGGNFNAVGVRSAIAKGHQIYQIGTIYEVDAVALTSATVGLTQTFLPPQTNTLTPVINNLIPLGANGLGTTVNTAGQCTNYYTNCTISRFIIAPGSEIVLNVNFVTPAGSSLKFYGCFLYMNYNFN